MDATAPTIALPMERPLYTPTAKMAMDSSGVSAGQGEFDASALYEQFFVDPARLSQVVRRSLQRQPQIGLAEVIAAQPLEQGLSELVTYLSLSDELFSVVFDEQATEQVHWADPDGSFAGGHHPSGDVHQDTSRSEPIMTSPSLARSELDLPLVVTTLMKGVIYRDTHENAWRHLLPLQTQVRDYVATIGLTVVVDEAEGYAFLRSRPEDGDDDSAPIPRLVARRSLSFHVSLLLALLRKKLAEFDAQGSDTRLVLTRTQIVDMVRVFLPPSSNEARLVDQIDALLTKVVDLGFLRHVKGSDAYEVRRILKAFVDAQWLAGFDEQLARYAAALSGDANSSDEESR